MPTKLGGTPKSAAATGMNTGMVTALMETTAWTDSVSITGRKTPDCGKDFWNGVSMWVSFPVQGISEIIIYLTLGVIGITMAEFGGYCNIIGATMSRGHGVFLNLATINF